MTLGLKAAGVAGGHGAVRMQSLESEPPIKHHPKILFGEIVLREVCCEHYKYSFGRVE